MPPRHWMFLLGLLAPACGGVDLAPPAPLALPGDQYYPESVTATPDGALYVGSVATGRVVVFPPGADAPTVFLPGGDPKGVTGLFADSGSGTLFVCAVDLTQLLGGTPPASEVRAYDLDTAAPKATYPLPGPSFCNDFAADDDGALYVTDSLLGRVYRLAPGATSLAPWSEDPLLGPSAPGGFGADGIAISGSDVYVNTFSDGRLVRIPIAGDGSAGAAEEIAVTPALSGPDAMRVLDDDTLLVVNGNSGQLVQVSVSGATGTSTVVREGLNMPTSVAIAGSTYWVTEGQVGVLFGLVEGPPALPFEVTPVAAPASMEHD